MANHIMRVADQFLTAIAAQIDKRVVGVRDDAFQIGFGNQVAAFWTGRFALRDGQLDFHEISGGHGRAYPDTG